MVAAVSLTFQAARAHESMPPESMPMENRLARVDQMVAARMGEQNIPGYSLIVMKDGRIVFKKSYGFADLASQRSATSDTIFGLASLTKTFTALTLLTLVDRGLIELDSPVGKYMDGLSPPYQALTIRQLASMTGGVPRRLAREVPWKRQLPSLDSTPLVSQPGSRFLYSNYSYRLLGTVIANVTGRPYLEMVREIILGPLGMQSTATTVLLQETGRVAQGYGDNMGRGPLRAIEYKNPAVSFSAGMLASTTDDLSRYVEGLLSRKMLSEKGYQTLWYQRPPLSTGEPSAWAFGWHAGTNEKMGGQYVVAMNGGTQGVASTIIILPDSNSAVIALCNLRKPPVYAIARNVAHIVFGSGEPPDNPEEFENFGSTGAD